MLGSCIAVFIMATLYEGLKVGRELLLKKLAMMQATTPHESSQPIALPSSDDEPTVPQILPSVRWAELAFLQVTGFEAN